MVSLEAPDKFSKRCLTTFLAAVNLLQVGVYCRELWSLCTCLTVLENASAASPSTEQHLISLELSASLAKPRGGQGMSAGQNAGDAAHPATSTPAMLVQSIVALTSSLLFSCMPARPPAHGHSDPDSQPDPYKWSESQSTSTDMPEDEIEPQSDRQGQSVADCLHAALSALMNLTHNNEAGCCKAEEAGGPEAAAALLIALSRCTTSASGSTEDPDLSDLQEAPAAAAVPPLNSSVNQQMSDPDRAAAAIVDSQAGSSFFTSSQSADAPPAERDAALGNESQSNAEHNKQAPRQQPDIPAALQSLLRVS